jgi:ATP-dependent protease Clp ATPase subunit
MFRRTPACSFCGRGSADVAKLVAGPRVYICDRCAAQAIEIMDRGGGAAEQPSSRAGLFAAMRTLLKRLRRGGSGMLLRSVAAP